MNRLGVNQAGLGFNRGGDRNAINPITEAYVSAMQVKPSDTQIAILDNRINLLSQAGVLSKLYQLCFFDIHEATAALINVVNPSQSCTNYSTTQEAINGCKATLGTHYIDSGLNLSQIPNAVYSDFSCGLYCSSVSPAIGATYMAGAQDNNGIQCLFSPAFSTLTVRGSLGSVGGALNYTLPSADYSGYFVVTRKGALTTDIACYQKGVELARGTSNAGSALPKANLYYLGFNYVGSLIGVRTNEYIKAAHIGKNLSQPESKALHDAISLYPWS